MDPKNPQPTAQALADHMHLVHRIVARFARRLPRSVRREDLVAAATLGLYHALRTSAHDSEQMFAAYARIRIRGAIVDELRRHDWSPRRRRSRATRNGEATLELVQPADGSAPAEDVGPGVTVVGFEDLPAHTLSALDVTSGGATYGSVSADTQLERDGVLANLETAMNTLPARDRDILRMRYFEGMPSKAIASALGLSEARISQVHARAIARLRAILVERDGEVELLAA